MALGTRLMQGKSDKKGEIKGLEEQTTALSAVIFVISSSSYDTRQSGFGIVSAVRMPFSSSFFIPTLD